MSQRPQPAAIKIQNVLVRRYGVLAFESKQALAPSGKRQRRTSPNVARAVPCGSASVTTTNPPAITSQTARRSVSREGLAWGPIHSKLTVLMGDGDFDCRGVGRTNYGAGSTFGLELGAGFVCLALFDGDI